MINSLTEKVKTLTTNLNLKKTLGLVFQAAKGWMILAIVMIFLETALFLGSIYALKMLIDKLSHLKSTVARNEDEIITHVVLAACLAIFYAIAKATSAYVTEVQATKVAHHLDEEIHLTAISLELSYYESPDYYDVLSRAKEAGSDRPNLMITTILEIAKNTLNLFAVGSLIFSINWILLPMLVLFILPTLFVRIYFSNKQNVWRIKHTPLERKSSYISNLLTSDTSAKEIRSFNLGDYFNELYKKIRVEVYQQKLSLSFKRTGLEVITTAIASMGFFTCITYIAIGTVRGTTSVGDIVLFLVIFPQSFSLIQNITNGIAIVYHNNIFINSIFELLALKKLVTTSESHQPISNFESVDLELKNVSFTYPHATNPTLTNINIRIPAGKIIAIIGLNGAGKSTLIKLLCKLYNPNVGTITLGGIDINTIEITAYRRQISPVFQDFSKYNVTVADNIRFGDILREFEMENVIDAAKRSGAHDFIKNLPNGYQTMMGRIFEDGHEVSIGQWQKLAIARALYSPARFLIFDEATSALDAIAEKQLFDSFRKRINNRSAVLISHRHSAVKHADYIYVLSGGTIAQEGTDKELLEMSGDYASLFKNVGISD